MTIQHSLMSTKAYAARLVVSCAIVAMPLQSQAVARTALAQQLRSADWTKRAEAFEKLSADSNAFASSSMSAELLHLLETEDEVIATTLRESHGRVGVSDKYGEGFGEYDAQVFELCMKYCDKAGFVRHLLYGARRGSETRNSSLEVIAPVFNHGFSQEQRDQLSDALIAGASDSTSNFIRYSSLLAINGVLRTGLVSAPRRDGMRRVAIANANDAYDLLREAAVSALGEIHDPRDRALLRDIAERDTSRTRIHGKMTYFVREAALKALDKLPP